jgi:acyl-CoA thioester hydrolase
MEVGYHHPARFNDALEVIARLSKKGNASLSFYQEVVRPSDSCLLCRGIIKIACIDRETMRPTPIPKKLMMEIPDVD